MHAQTPGPDAVWLRILETTDVHGHLMSYDYARDKDVKDFGLARTATLIRRARAETQNTVLLDNGDFLQGSALTDIGARPEAGWNAPNPVITAMNALGYDAATLGNHEFNFGLGWLKSALGDACFPLVCANAVLTLDPSTPLRDRTLLPPYVILQKTVTDESGQTHVLHIGIIGLLPPQTTDWDRDHLEGYLQTRDIVATAQAYVPRMRAEGAQIILALAHTGIASGFDSLGLENAALPLARVDGVDAVLSGHTHQVFPDPTVKSQDPEIDFDFGTLAGTPTVMAGFRGSHLGVVDLLLQKQDHGWQVTAHHVKARAVRPASSNRAAHPDQKILDVVAPAHLKTLSQTRVMVGHCDMPIHSYLAQVLPDRGQQIVLASKRDAIKTALRNTQFADLPTLAVSAPYKTGGHAGPDYYTNIPAGPISIRNVTDFYPFPNTLVCLQISGEHIHEWLERAASCFYQIKPGKTQQQLWNPAFAGHMFDTISGVTYRIDLSQPAKYDPNGKLVDPSTSRIRDLSYDGKPVPRNKIFALVSKSFRMFGGSYGPEPTKDVILHKGAASVNDIIMNYIREHGCASALSMPRPWCFHPVAEATVTLETGPGVMGYLADLDQLSARVIGPTDQGFIRLEIPM